MPAVGSAPGRNEFGEQQCRRSNEAGRSWLGSEVVDTFGENTATAAGLASSPRALPVLIDHLTKAPRLVIRTR
jgi:hypothetical protein